MDKAKIEQTGKKRNRKERNGKESNEKKRFCTFRKDYEVFLAILKL